MIAAAGRGQKRQIAPDDDVLGRRWPAGQPQPGRPLPLVHHAAGREVHVLGVLDDGDVVVARVLERPAHQLGIGHRQAVVGDRDHAGIYHVADLGHLGALLAPADGADRPDAGVAVALRLVQHVLGHRAVVVDRIGVGHRRHRGEAAGRSGTGAAFYRLLVLLARLAQVDVHVDQPRSHHQTLGVDDLGATPRTQALTQPDDLAVLDQDIADRVEILRRIDDPAAADEELHSASLCMPDRR